ncbi:hypothetical protein JCM10450v2_003107 [Rhodotorula kratochvilovae]
MAAPPLLLLVLSHTLLLSLLPLLLLQSLRLSRSSNGIQSILVAASTLCVGLYGLCALVALAGTGVDEGRVASVVAGTLGCLSVLLMDVFLVANVCCEKRDDAGRRSRSPSGKVVLAALLSGLILAAAALHVVLLCLSSAHSTRLALAVGRAVVHLVFLAVVALLLLRSLVHGYSTHDTETVGPSASQLTSTAGAWYEQEPESRFSAALRSPQAGLVLAQLFGIALDVSTVVFPVHLNFTLLAEGGTSAPTLFGTTSSTTAYVAIAVLAVFRWAGTLSVVTGKSRLVASKAGERTSGKPAPRSSFLSLGTRRESVAGVVELEHPYLHTQTLPATYASSTGKDDEAEDLGRSEDLVVPPSPSPLPGGRRGGRILPSLPPPTSAQNRSSPILHRAHHSLPPLLTSTPPPRPYTALRTISTASGEAKTSPLQEGAGGTPRRTSSSLSGTLPLLVRKISRTFSPPPTLGAESLYRFPRHRPSLSLDTTPSRSPEHTRSFAHASTDAPSSTYFSPLSSPRPVQPASTSSSPIKLRRSSLPRRGSVPDGLSSGSSSPAPNSALSLSLTNRRRSGSVGSLLRTVAAGAGASTRSSLTPTPTPTREVGGMSWWDVEPNESEDDPFARSAPPSASSASLRERGSRVDLAEEGVALRLRRALEAIEEPPTGSREGSARTSAKCSSPAEEDEENEAVERVLTPTPSRASGEEPSFGRVLHRQASGTSSIFREHLDSPLSPGSTSSLSSLTETTAHPLDSSITVPNALGLEGPLVPVNVTPRRRRTDQKASMSPSASAGRRLREALKVESDDEVTAPQFLFGGTTGSSSAGDSFGARSAPAVASALLHSPRRTTRSERARPSILPLAGAFPSSASPPLAPIQRSASFTFRSKRSSSASSPSLLAAPALALRRMRRRSPSPHSTSRISESSDLSFACRGAMASVSDLNAPASGVAPTLALPDSSSDGEEALEKVADETAVPSGAGVPRRPWWNRLPGSRPSTPYLRSSTSPIVPRRSSTAPSSTAFGRSRSATVGSSALLAPRSSIDEHSSASSHARSASVPLLSGPHALRWSQLQLPPIRDVSPFSSSIFHPRRSGSDDRPEPVPSLPASLAAQHHLAAPRESFLSLDSSPRTSLLSRRSALRHEDVVHELDALVGCLAVPFLGGASHNNGSYEFPERSFNSASSVSAAASSPHRGEHDREHEGQRARDWDGDEQYAAVVETLDSPPLSSPLSAGGLTTPTSSALLASSPLFSPSSFSTRRPSAADASGSEGEELLSPLTPASAGWGSFGDTGDGLRAWKEKRAAREGEDGEEERV